MLFLSVGRLNPFCRFVSKFEFLDGDASVPVQRLAYSNLPVKFDRTRGQRSSWIGGGGRNDGCISGFLKLEYNLSDLSVKNGKF